jgi:putative transposase
MGFGRLGSMKKPTLGYHRHRFPSQVISHAAWLYHRFSLSIREVEELLAERGVMVTYETVRGIVNLTQV